MMFVIKTQAADVTGQRWRADSQCVRSRISRRRLRAAILAIAAVTATGGGAPAQAAVPTDQRCNSPWMSEAGTRGSGASFEISLRPTWKSRVVRANGGTDRIWDALWHCVRGGYPGARLTPAQGESVYQQLYCHVKYGYPPSGGGPTWDLEAHRPPIAWDRITVPINAYQHKCNW
jgi:hypothetical protein